MNEYTWLCINECMYVSMRMRVYVFTCARVLIHPRVCIACVCVCADVCVHAHVHMRTLASVHTHTQNYISVSIHPHMELYTCTYRLFLLPIPTA